MHFFRFLGLSAPLAVLAVVFACAARSAEYVENSSFERETGAWLGNWAGHNARLLPIRGGAAGRYAVRVLQRRGARDFSIVPKRTPVTSAVGRKTYVASAWVRSTRPGRRVFLRVREWRRGEVVSSAQVSVVTTHRWQRLPLLNYRARASGSALDVYVYQPDAADGDRFDVDDLSLADPVTATATDHAHVRLDWSPVFDAVRYAVYRDTLLVGVTRGRSFTDALLWPETSYAYRIAALDRRGDVITTRVAAATTMRLPAAGFPRPFPETSFWNRPVGPDPRIDPRTGARIAYLLRDMRAPNLALHEFAVAVAEAHPDDPRYAVPCLRYRRCTLGAFGRIPIPLTAQPDVGKDGHLAVYDPGTQRSWDMWQASRRGNSWVASAGAAVSTRGPGVAPPGTIGANAANFPLLGGLIRPEEILQGRIDHALVFTLPHLGRGRPVCPATHNAGSSRDPDALREGHHLQLDPALDVSTLPIAAWQRPIMRAMQVYGMYLRDGGGTLAILAENPISRGYDAWGRVAPELAAPRESMLLPGVPWERFRVLAAPDGPHCK
jgi:hypothetical protein